MLAIGGELYSDTYSHATLKKIGRKIKFSFYTPLRLLKILKKCLVVRFFSFGEFVSFLGASPRLLISIIAREMRKNRLGVLPETYIHKKHIITLLNSPPLSARTTYLTDYPAYSCKHR